MAASYSVYTWILYIVFQLLIFAAYGAKVENQEELTDKDGYYDSETPADWVDYLFAAFMFFHHGYYAYKFTDYSLSHIHSVTEEKENAAKLYPDKHELEKKMEKEEQKKEPQMKRQKTQAQLEHEKEKKEKKAEKQMKQAARVSNFTTKSSQVVNVRRSNTVCCCIKCAPKIFTWGRTGMLRLFFRIYMTVSSLLAMVLYMEFFMNLLVEFFITCIVHWQQGYIVALILIPLILYVIETLIRMSWHSVWLAWKTNCDMNGDVEVTDTDGHHHFNLQGNRFLFSFREDDGDIEDAYNDEEFESSGGSSSELESSEFSDEESASGNRDDHNASPRPEWNYVGSYTQNSPQPSAGLKPVEEEDIDLSGLESHDRTPSPEAGQQDTKTKRNQPRSQSNADTDKLAFNMKIQMFNANSNRDADRDPNAPVTPGTPATPSVDTQPLKDEQAKPTKKKRSQTETEAQLRRSAAGTALSKEEIAKRREQERLREEKQKAREERRRRRKEIKAERAKAKQLRKEMRKKQREQMGDYFLATCWRAWFMFATVLAALVGSYTVSVDVGTNSLFWQLVMRYCVVGAIIWGIVYTVLAFILCICSRMLSWALLHPHIPRYRFFCLLDAKDHEKKHKGWAVCKAFTMMLALVIFVTFIVFGLLFGSREDQVSGFMIFIGIVWVCYYLNNLFMSCKPMGLIALWTDEIPPPGKNFFAHLQISAKMQDAGQLDNMLAVNRGATQHARVGTGTTLELARMGSDTGSPGAENKQLTEATSAKLDVPNGGAHATQDSDSAVLDGHTKKNTMTVHEVGQLEMETGVSAYARTNTMTRTKTTEIFAAERVTALLNRYKKFKFNYKDAELKYKKEMGEDSSYWSMQYVRLKLKCFWLNYKNYWLNVYRPFDEYDMETNLSSTHILFGFQWAKACVECRCSRKKSTKGKCATICGYLMDNTCNLCLIALSVGLIAGLFFFATAFGSATSGEALDTYDTALVDLSVGVNRTVVQYYPVCSEFFGAEANKISESDLSRSHTDLSVLDALFLAQVVYEMDNFKIDEMLDEYFDGQFDLLKTNYEVPYYFHVKLKDKTVPLDFVAVRGTASIEEALQDISLFVEVALFEGLQWFVPILNALPVSFATAFIYYASLTEKLINADARAQFDTNVYNYLGDYLLNETTSLHIVGHSLGGAISAIVAANLFEDGYDSYVASFGVCSPGVLYSSAKFDFGSSALDKTSRSLLPRRDLVSQIDIHGGSVAYTECSEDSMLNCHVTPSVICEVYSNCPIQLARKPEVFECFCFDTALHNLKGRKQFGDCLNVTECEGAGCHID